MSLLENAVGYTSAIFISTLLIPQIFRSYKLKSAKDLSWGTIYLSMMIGYLSSVYGFLINKPPIYIPNIITVITSTILAYMKCIYNEE